MTTKLVCSIFHQMNEQASRNDARASMFLNNRIFSRISEYMQWSVGLEQIQEQIGQFSHLQLPASLIHQLHYDALRWTQVNGENELSVVFLGSTENKTAIKLNQAIGVIELQKIISNRDGAIVPQVIRVSRIADDNLGKLHIIGLECAIGSKNVFWANISTVKHDLHIPENDTLANQQIVYPITPYNNDGYGTAAFITLAMKDHAPLHDVYLDLYDSTHLYPGHLDHYFDGQENYMISSVDRNANRLTVQTGPLAPQSWNLSLPAHFDSLK